MQEIIEGDLYNYPKYYDLVFSSDWKAEHEFFLACFEKHAKCKVQRIFEPACGTGRLLIKLAQSGFAVAGNDLNPHAIDFCNDRLERFGFPRSAVIGDMSDFKVRKKSEAAFNTINSFRHLPSEAAAEGHLRCMAKGLKKGGLYLLGLHLSPTVGKPTETESWSARRGHLVVNTHMWMIDRNKRKRNERLGIHFDIYTPTRQFRIIDTMDYRTYTSKQMRQLLSRVPELEIAETYDFMYELDHPVKITAETEDVVYVLRKK